MFEQSIIQFCEWKFKQLALQPCKLSANLNEHPLPSSIKGCAGASSLRLHRNVTRRLHGIQLKASRAARWFILVGRDQRERKRRMEFEIWKSGGGLTSCALAEGYIHSAKYRCVNPPYRGLKRWWCAPVRRDVTAGAVVCRPKNVLYKTAHRWFFA